MTRIPTISGEERDCLGRGCWTRGMNAGRRKHAKRGYWRRFRKTVRRALAIGAGE